MSNEILSALLAPIFRGQGYETRVWDMVNKPLVVTSEKDLATALASGAKRFVPFVQLGNGQGYSTAVGLVQTGKQPGDYDVCFFPLPPTLVAAWESGCYALWAMSEPLPRDVTNQEVLFRPPLGCKENISCVATKWFLPIPGVDGCHALRWRPDLIYRGRDVWAASLVNRQVIELILSRPPVMGRTGQGVLDRVEGELEVILALREAGLSTGTIELIFAEQPIGDPYRPVSSPVGALTLVDVFASWVLTAVRENMADFPYEIRPNILWFSLSQAATDWLQARRLSGETALSAPELSRAAAETSQSVSLGRGYYFVGPMKTKLGRTTHNAFGIDLNLACRAGLGTISKTDRVVA